jgi:hypothetical protein
MESQPVRHYGQPAYPTRRDVLAGAASFALVNLLGSSFLFAEPEGGKITVAPIFEHGTGRGATGCMVITPPVFLSEEEALLILREELAVHGIQLKSGAVFENVRIPHRFKIYDLKETDKKDPGKAVIESKKKAKPLKLTGLDSKKKVAVQFISEKPYYDLGGIQDSYGSNDLDKPEKKKGDSEEYWFHVSSVQGYDFKDAANFMIAQVKKQGGKPVYLGVFYDPLEPNPKNNDKKTDREKIQELAWLKKSPKNRKTESKKLLRSQAQDFIAWLKEKKAIK